jgi:hypothetical protein
LNQLVKGCNIAIYNSILLTEEVRQLQLENAKQKKKRVIQQRYIATSRSLILQEGLALSEPTVELVVEAVGRVATDEPVVYTHVLSTCRLYKSLLYTARNCPTKQVS